MPDPAPVVVVITCDPRTSHRAFEAMRIGVGIVAGENEVTFVLAGPAVHLLDSDTDELIDGDDVAKFRASLRNLDIPFHVDAASVPGDADWNDERHRVISVTVGEIAGLLRSGRRSLVF